ncbi:hypothetical protein [Polynucleobacter asymbioticus]|jgi:DNA-binding transcriptional regulator YiaG|uniref:hypothetical protein n=1 Tax=Polynucleobacter asymbioticus TaxID=576611 RepID=UPI0008F7F34B|nr:hypothetical protein [Polynucleobacter asymbioticus]
MDYETFSQQLKELGIKKTEFMRFMDMNTGTISTWSKTNKVPRWVEAYLELVLKAKDMLPKISGKE